MSGGRQADEDVCPPVPVSVSVGSPPNMNVGQESVAIQTDCVVSTPALSWAEIVVACV